MLTREKLKHLGALMNEVKAIEDEIAALDRARLDARMVADTAKGSSPQFPYTTRVYTLVGQDGAEVARLTKKIINRRRKLRRVKLAREAEYDNLTAEIEAVPDVVVRSILRYKYREGLNWQQVAGRMGDNYTADGVRMAAARYLDDTESIK